MDKIYSVSEFNKIFKNEIESNPVFSNFFLKGELSGVSYYKSGHLYFTLKDKNSGIRCTAFSYKMKKIPEDLKEGDSVKLFCDATVYEVRGEFTVLVRHLEKENVIGEKFAKLEEIKKRLEKEGYFSQIHKKKLPKYPENIGIVTSYTGAALQDMIKTIRKRDNRVNIYVYDAKVQGIGSKEEIIKGIETLNKIPEIDYIVCGRGGGSVEDLWSFNEESVALAFFNSKKPIISAVGHEVDTLLSDYTADVRAATPTQAIELSLPERSHLIKDIKEKRGRVERVIKNKMENSLVYLSKLKDSYALRNLPREIESLGRELLFREEKILLNMDKNYKEKDRELRAKIEKIISLNPLKILSSGYSITTVNNKTLKTYHDVKIGDVLESRLSDGVIESTVIGIKE